MIRKHFKAFPIHKFWNHVFQSSELWPYFDQPFFLTNQTRGGGIRSSPWTNSSAAFRRIMSSHSKFLNIIFETFPLNPWDQFLEFDVQANKSTSILWRNIKNAQFLFQPTSTLCTSKEQIFHVECKLTKKMYRLLHKKIFFFFFD